VATAVEASKLGAFDFIEKPLESDRVLLVVRNAVEQGRLKRKVAGFKENEGGRYRMVGGERHA
jgi:two-component system nitrogen regulation response regulator NtrX